MTLLFLVTLIFLPNIGLWSLYREKHFMKSTVLGEQQVSETNVIKSGSSKANCLGVKWGVKVSA